MPRDHGAHRISPRKRGYTHEWDMARRAYLVDHPLCLPCQRKGRATRATEVDHIQPHRGDMSLFWDRSNWQPICRSCHEAKSATEQSNKKEIGLDGWPIDDTGT